MLTWSHLIDQNANRYCCSAAVGFAFA